MWLTDILKLKLQIVFLQYFASLSLPHQYAVIFLVLHPPLHIPASRPDSNHHEAYENSLHLHCKLYSVYLQLVIAARLLW